MNIPKTFINIFFTTLIFAASSVNSCVIVDDAIYILELINAAELTDNYLYRTKKTFVELTAGPLLLLKHKPLELYNLFKHTNPTTIQCFLSDLQTSGRNLISALEATSEFNQDLHDLGALTQNILNFTNNIVVGFSTLNKQAGPYPEELL